MATAFQAASLICVFFSGWSFGLAMDRRKARLRRGRFQVVELSQAQRSQRT